MNKREGHISTTFVCLTVRKLLGALTCGDRRETWLQYNNQLPAGINEVELHAKEV